MEPNTWVSAKTSVAQVKAPQRGTALRAALWVSWWGQVLPCSWSRGQHRLLVLGIPEGNGVDVAQKRLFPAACALPLVPEFQLEENDIDTHC